MSGAEAQALYFCVEYLRRLPQELDLPSSALLDLAVFHQLKIDIAKKAETAT